jgi:hypothetical protein
VKKGRLASRFVILVSLAVFAATAAAQGWKLYEAKAYGFSMLIPEGTMVREREWSGGWGGIYAQHEGVRLYGLAKLGTKASDDEIEKFAVDVVGIPREAWTLIDAGKMKKGWIRYHTVKAMKGSKLVFGGYGVGPKGSYLLYLETTPADFREHEADYEKWYASIELE